MEIALLQHGNAKTSTGPSGSSAAGTSLAGAGRSPKSRHPGLEVMVGPSGGACDFQGQARFSETMHDIFERQISNPLGGGGCLPTPKMNEWAPFGPVSPFSTFSSSFYLVFFSVSICPLFSFLLSPLFSTVPSAVSARIFISNWNPRPFLPLAGPSGNAGTKGSDFDVSRQSQMSKPLRTSKPTATCPPKARPECPVVRTPAGRFLSS